MLVRVVRPTMGLGWRGAMKRTSFIQIAGLAAMVGGTIYASGELFDGGSLFFVLLLVGAMVAMLAIAALYASRRDTYGSFGVLTSLSAFVGLVLLLVGELGLSDLAAYIGLLLASLGVLALGIMSMASRVLPWWCGVVLIVWGPTLVLRLVGFSVPLGGILVGIPWIVVGYALFRVETRVGDRPSRVR